MHILSYDYNKLRQADDKVKNVCAHLKRRDDLGQIEPRHRHRHPPQPLQRQAEVAPKARLECEVERGLVLGCAVALDQQRVACGRRRGSDITTG